MLNLFKAKTTKVSTKFSTFIREAKSRERKRVYADVLKGASERQNKVLKAASTKEREVA